MSKRIDLGAVTAYAIAVKNGFKGTEADWLASLKGAKGDKGDPLTWDVLTEEQKASLKGEKGPKGDTGPQGPAGPKGDKGDDGQPGENGTDGCSPTANVTQNDNGATITIIDKNGTTMATVTNGKDGIDGSPGKDGHPGADGYTPVKGKDYFTEADKAEIVSSVIASLPVYDGSVTAV